MPKFFFLQYVDEAIAPKPGTPELQAQVDAYAKLFEEVSAAGILRGGDPMQPSAAAFCVQVRDGQTKVTDGLMHKEAPGLNGYWVWECKDRAEAEAWAARIPAAQNGTVQVHPIWEM